MSKFIIRDVRFDRVLIDILGPLPSLNGYGYLLTCIDRLNCWTEAIPIPNITAETIAKAFVQGWIARFGVPSSIITDRKLQSESALWKELIQFLRTTRCRTTAYHPCANGLVERFHHQLKASLKTLQDSSKRTDALPLVLLSIYTTLKKDLKCTTAELVYGTTLRLPGYFFTLSSSSTFLPDPEFILHTSKTPCP